MSDKMRLMSTSSKFLSTKEDGVRINDSTCSVGHIDDTDKVLEPKDGVQNGGEDSRQQCNICQKEPSFIKHSAEPRKNCSLEPLPQCFFFWRSLSSVIVCCWSSDLLCNLLCYQTQQI
ncbi:hypothetical protein ACE6H2_008253 [Prunus campanulata]